MGELVAQIEGKLGRALALSGMAAAVVDPDGRIRAASTGFALRAAGDAQAVMAGTDFVSLLKQDDNDHITWARDGRKGQPLTMYYLPVADPDLAGNPDPEATPSLMLMVDSGAGIGGGRAIAPPPCPIWRHCCRNCRWGWPWRTATGGCCSPTLPSCAPPATKAKRRRPTRPIWSCRKTRVRSAIAIRRFGQGPANSGDLAIRLAAQPDDPVSLSLAGVRGLGEAAVFAGADRFDRGNPPQAASRAGHQDAGGRPAGGRCGARFQQCAHRHSRHLRSDAAAPHTPGDSDYDDIQQIRANSNRAASLTRQLLAFSRQQTLRPEVLQLPDVVSDVSHLLKRLIGEKIQLTVTHDRNLGPVRADPTQLEQVIVNLCVNARDAMQSKNADGSGKLSLMTKRITARDVRAMRSEIVPQAEYTALIVEDTGGGIPPEHLGKIFEPFFTTKEQGKGHRAGPVHRLRHRQAIGRLHLC